MSAQAIRTAARAMVADASWPAIPFYETINQEPDPDVVDELGVWCSLDFDLFDTEPLCVGPLPKDFRETGAITVVVLGLSGRGDSAAVTAAELARDAVNAWAAWPSGFHVDTVSNPINFDPDSDGQWIRFDVEVQYRYDYVLN